MSLIDAQYEAFLERARSLPPMHATPLSQLRAGRPFTAAQGHELRTVTDILASHGELQVPVRLYRDSDDVLPALIFFHGGGFVMGGLEGYYDPLCRRIAREAGCAVIAVDYRLAPEHKYPAGPDDCYAVLEWTAANHAALGIDAGRTVVAGPSAGGNLAAVTAIRARDRSGPTLAGPVLFYPVVDHYSRVTHSYQAFSDGYHLTRDDMVWFWDQYLPEGMGVPTDAVPLQAETLGQLPPTLLVTAEFDPLRDEGEAFAQRLTDHGVAVDLVRLDGSIHGFLSVSGARTETALLHALDWLRTLWSNAASR